MDIKKAPELGLCTGIRRAINLLKEAANKYGSIETLGPLAHNHLLVEDLVHSGVKPVNHLDQVQGKFLAITTHGTSPSVLSDIKSRGLSIVDTTCPIVQKVQNIVKELAENGFYVIIFGEAEHSEVKGLLGWTEGKGIAALNMKQIHFPDKTPSHLGIISQTTQTQSAFTEFASQLTCTVGSEVNEIRTINTLCQVTQRHQQAAMRLAHTSDLMIVIGGKDSANTRRLVETCSSIVETHLVETVDTINHSWFVDKHHIGITAGASTPDETIDEIITKLNSL